VFSEEEEHHHTFHLGKKIFQLRVLSGCYWTKISSKLVWMKFYPIHIKLYQMSKHLICTLNIKGHLKFFNDLLFKKINLN
jgi:hypothetical protein